MFANPYTLIAIGLALAASHGFVGWKSYHLGQDNIIATQAKEATIEERTRAAALAAVSEEIGKIKVKNVYTTQRLERETVEKPVYRDCVHDDAAFSLLNDALTAPEDRAADADNGVVPEAGSTK